MGVLDELTFDVEGLAAPLDFIVGARLLYSDATWELYDNYHVDGDVALQFGVTVNKLTNLYTLTVVCNYGHRGSTNATPTRRNLSATLTWNLVTNGMQEGSIAGMRIDEDQGGGFSVESGISLAPLIMQWNKDTTSQVGPLFEGHLLAFQQNSIWHRNPNEAGESDRFAFRFDPAREDVSYNRLMRAYTYGGAWLEDDANGTYVRPDLLRFHLNDSDPWYRHGTGFWMQSNQPTTTANWRQIADRAHADAGYLPFCSAFVHGGVDVHTDPAYHFAIKKFAAQLLGHFPPPFESWPDIFYNTYFNDALRAQGRPIALGVWVWRSLVIVEQYRPNDAEVTTLRLAVQKRILDIFSQVYEHSKPKKLFPNDPAPIIGLWSRGGTQADMPHPERNHGGPSELQDVSLWMAGELWKGLYHLWEGLKELGLESALQFLQCRQLMDYITSGDPGATQLPDQLGLFGLIVKWKNSHPHLAPSPLPPAWASAPSWPAPQLYTVGGFGWAFEYGFVWYNTNPPDVNADLQYLSAPSSGVTGNRIALFEFMKREGMVTTQPDIAKLDEIIGDYAHKNYTYHLGESLVLLVDDQADHRETIDTDLQGAVALVLVVDDLADNADTVDPDLSEDTLILVVDDAADNADGVVLDAPAILVIGDTQENREGVVFDGPESELVLLVPDVWRIGDPAGGDVVMHKEISGTGRILPTLLGSGVLILPPLVGGVPMKTNQDFAVTRGDHVTQPFFISLDGGRELDGAEIWRTHIRDGRAGSTALAEMSSPSAGIEVDPVTFQPKLVFLPATLPIEKFVPTPSPKPYRFDLEMLKDQKVETTAEGQVTITTDVTRD